MAKARLAPSVGTVYERIMNILVVGASQGTGALSVKTALDRGHRVTAFARSPEKLTLSHANLTRVAGSFHDRGAVEAVVPGHDAVLITASTSGISGFRKNPNYFSQGTALVVDAMKAASVERLVVLSALGVGESRAQNGFLLNTLVVDFVLRGPFQDHERQEKLVKESGLAWVIARPARLHDGPARHAYAKETGTKKVPGSIARADVADFLVEAAEIDTWVRKGVQLGG